MQAENKEIVAKLAEVVTAKPVHTPAAWSVIVDGEIVECDLGPGSEAEFERCDRRLTVAKIGDKLLVKHLLYVRNTDLYIQAPGDFAKEAMEDARRTVETSLSTAIDVMTDTNTRLTAHYKNLKYGYARDIVDTSANRKISECRRGLKKYLQQESKEYRQYEFELTETFATNTGEPVMRVMSGGVAIIIANNAAELLTATCSSLRPVGVTTVSLMGGIHTHGPEALANFEWAGVM